MFKDHDLSSVAIIPGFSEGPWHSKRLRQALYKAGYLVINDLGKADIIIAHSGGCFDIPSLTEHQLLVLINPTYWPGKPLVLRGNVMTWRLIKAVRPGNHPFYHLYKTIHNIFYLLCHPIFNHRMAKRAETFELSDVVQHVRTILIRNNDDPWLTPDLEPFRKYNPNLRIERLPGEHDDCWQNPEPYIRLLQSVT